MAKEIKIQVKSMLDSTLIHNGIVIEAGEIVALDEETAKELIDKKFCEQIKVKGI